MVSTGEYRIGVAPRYESGMRVGELRVWVIGSSIIVTDEHKTTEYGRKLCTSQVDALANLARVVIRMQAGRTVEEALS